MVGTNDQSPQLAKALWNTISSCSFWLQTAAWETARLRVRVTSMAAENDALKNHVAQLMHQISNMDRSVQVLKLSYCQCICPTPSLGTVIVSWLTSLIEMQLSSTHPGTN